MTDTKTRALRILAGASLLVAGTPTLALAEEEGNTGLTLLLPNMSEFIPACIAFIIIFIILSKFAWPFVLKMMEDRESKIQGDFDAAEQARTDAEEAKRQLDEQLADAHRQAEEIIAQARREAEEERATILAKAQTDAVATMAKARGAVESERKKALIELSGSVVDLAVEIASKVVGNDLTDDEHRALAMRYLEEVGSTNGE